MQRRVSLFAIIAVLGSACALVSMSFAPNSRALTSESDVVSADAENSLGSSTILVHNVLATQGELLGRELSVFGFLGSRSSGDAAELWLLPFDEMPTNSFGDSLYKIALRIVSEDRPTDFAQNCIGEFVVAHGRLEWAGGSHVLVLSSMEHGIVSYGETTIDFCH